MKQKFLLGAVALCLAVGLTSCGGEKQEEMTKMIPADAVTLSGKHKKLLTIPADSVKVMLVRVSDSKWEVRAVIPMQNTTEWSQVPGTNPSKSKYFEPRMGNLTVNFVDANESEIDMELSPDYDVVASILSSDETVTEKVLIKEDSWSSRGDKSYAGRRAMFDKVAGISITNMDLSEVTTAKESRSTIQDAYDAAIDDAVDAYEKAIDNAVDAYRDVLGL